MTNTITSLTYRVPLPPRGSGSNARGRWTRSRAAREYRAECADAYREQGVPTDAPWERVYLAVEMRVCRRRPSLAWLREHAGPESRAYLANREAYRPKDAANVFDACKSAIDALQPEQERRTRRRGILRITVTPGAGVAVGDDAKHMTLGAPVLTEVASFAEEGVWLHLTRVEAMG